MNLKLLKPLKVNLMWPSLNLYVFYELFNVSVLFAQLTGGSLTAKFPAIWSMNQAIKYLVWSELVFRKFSSSCFSHLDIMRPRQHRTTDQQCLVARLQTGCSQTEMTTESSAGCKWTQNEGQKGTELDIVWPHTIVNLSIVNRSLQNQMMVVQRWVQWYKDERHLSVTLDHLKPFTSVLSMC